jgi:hypothetical protein
MAGVRSRRPRGGCWWLGSLALSKAESPSTTPTTGPRSRAYARCDASADDARVRAEVFYHKLYARGTRGEGALC